MWKRCISCVLLAVMLGSAAYGQFNPLKDPTIIGWWTCDEGTGSVVADSSPKHHDGRFINGNPAWRTGVYGNAITLVGPTLVEVPPMGLTLSQATMAGWLFAPTAQPEWASIIMHRAPGPASGFNMLADRQLAYHWNDAADTWSYRGNVPHPLNEWAHCAVTVEPTKATFYLNGVQRAVNNVNHSPCAWDGPVWLGGDGGSGWVARRMSGGSLDDVCFFSRALTADEVKSLMKGLARPGVATDPVPGDAAVDVPRDASLSWTAGPWAATHDVYLGKAFADVNDATRTNAKGVLVSQGQKDAAYKPASVLAYGQTYYWRVDEVNKPADNTTFKGDVWSFTVEPYGYPVKPVKTTASSNQASMGPENTINGSGLTGDLHGAEPTTMWMSAGAKPNWIQYEFDKAYRLGELQVWNSNQLIETFLGFGAKTVVIETSVDGTTWTPLANVPEFARASGMAGYAANTTVNFGGVEAKFVKLTINANWGGMAPQTGLAEVRFSYIPVQARAPQPATAATGVSIDADLNWRPGREAATHSVSFGTAPNALGAAKKVTDHSFDPGSLNFGTKYYWKVDEVNAVTYPGEVWSFTTQEYKPIDDFESYTDQAGAEIFTAWVDGYATGLNGSTVGNDTAAGGTFGETGVIHGGKQSMPMIFDNSKSPFYSEATQTFASLQDWTGNGANTLSLWVQGQPAAFVDKGNGAFTVGASGHDIWDAADDFRFVYKKLSGDGSIVVKVDSLLGSTNTWAKAGVMIRTNLTDGSPMVDMVIANPNGANGANFQWRATAGAAASSTNSPSTPNIKTPQWVKLTRKSNVFSGQYSADGVTWLDIKNPALTGTLVTTTVNMPGDVYIGLCLTSHDSAQTAVAEFSGAATTGNVSGAWQQVWIGDDPDRTMDLASLYMIVEDSAGKSATATNATIANATAWTQWSIPFSSLTGVNLAKVKKLTIGVGDKKNPAADGSGRVFIDDIGFGKPAQ